MVRALRTFVALLAAVTAAACTVSETNPPPLAGPSELGLSLTLSAKPDVIYQDGAAQARVEITARDANGQPKRDVDLRVEITQGGYLADFGTLSPGKNVSTGSDGKAVLTYTAPPPPLQPVDTGHNIITLAVTPLGTDYRNATVRTVDIRLVPVGVIVPPTDMVAGFTMSPATAAELDNVAFNAGTCGSATTDCTKGSIVGYAWDFGDGTTGTGMVATHQYSRAGVYVVTLTVSDALGRAVSATKTCTVTASAAPKADFTFSPTAPVPLVLMYFNASTSTAAAGRTIVSYQWNWGDGGQSPERAVPTEDHIYNAEGDYTVTLTVVDDAGRRISIAKVVSVKF